MAQQTRGSNGFLGFGGGSESSSTTNVGVVSPVQRNLLYALQQAAYMGNLGDMGGGTAFRQGQSNLAQMMADRGISQDSGVYSAALGNVAAQAQQADTNALRQYILGLAGTPVQVVNADSWIGTPTGGPLMSDSQWFSGRGLGRGLQNRFDPNQGF